MDTGYKSAGKHVHDRSSSFAGRLGLDGDVATAAANGVVHAESVCPRATAEQQKPEYDAADHRIGMFPYTRKLRGFADWSAFPERRAGETLSRFVRSDLRPPVCEPTPFPHRQPEGVSPDSRRSFSGESRKGAFARN